MQPRLGRLLVIDDEQGIADLVSKIATSVGYVTRALMDSAGFENIVQEWAPTVIILDIVMPDRDGLELIGVLAAVDFKGQLVIMSGADPLYSQMAAASAKTRGLKVAQTLPKPFEPPMSKRCFAAWPRKPTDGPGPCGAIFFCI